MSVYGHRFDNLKVNCVEEQVILTEMHISKKDLQNPEILKKVLADSKKETTNHNTRVATACGLLGICCDIILGIVSGSIGLALIYFTPFIIGSLAIAVKCMKEESEVEKKNIDKLVSKAKELKTKTMRLKDSKEKKRILDNCDKILASVNKYHKDKEIEAEKIKTARIKEDIEYIEDLIKGTISPDGDVEEIYRYYIIAKNIGISTSTLDNAIKKTCVKDVKDDGEKIISMFLGSKDIDSARRNNNERTVDDLIKAIPGFKENTDILVFYAIDDTIFFFNPVDNKFYYGGYHANELDSYSSLYDLCKKESPTEEDSAFSEEEIEKYKELYNSNK